MLHLYPIKRLFSSKIEAVIGGGENTVRGEGVSKDLVLRRYAHYERIIRSVNTVEIEAFF